MVMHTVPPPEDQALTTCLARAASVLGADGVWAENPVVPRRLRCGITFDAVVCDLSLIETAYRLLDRYEQQLGPAFVVPSFPVGALLVPVGVEARWPDMVAATQWPARAPHPVCLGRGQMIEVPAPAATAASLTRWLRQPEFLFGLPPHLTSPIQLARCLAEALLISQGTR
ncbi:hypothetical protein [Streptomyces sp. NBC_01803]|uniref:hypothetical protein n=1 Tax=Streptomyces sp. NBC_01803 TaxID=2975946 RepID=UPI002DDA0FF0|nr:hypothetical protein [Streptomyces sp. NBC_01803]WSA43678.1 hypothetical protein OIE51_05340 [Streptomyces sp. NBC_01803]